jgi:hypothetical protein
MQVELIRVGTTLGTVFVKFQNRLEFEVKPKKRKKEKKKKKRKKRGPNRSLKQAQPQRKAISTYRAEGRTSPLPRLAGQSQS